MAYKRDREAFLFSTLGEKENGHPLHAEPASDASDTFKEPYLRLFVGIVVQGMRDLQSDDPIIALDAYGWLESTGFPICRHFGIVNLSDDKIFQRLFGGGEWVISLNHWQRQQKT
jgi:hypothetical protein